MTFLTLLQSPSAPVSPAPFFPPPWASPGHAGGGGGSSASGGVPVGDDLERLRRHALPTFEADDVDLHIPSTTPAAEPTPAEKKARKEAKRAARTAQKATVAVAVAGAAAAALITGGHKKRRASAEAKKAAKAEAVVSVEFARPTTVLGRVAKGGIIARANPPVAPVPTDIAALPVAHGRLKGRVCLICKERRPVTAFEGTKRICRSCRADDAHRLYVRKCAVCGTRFETISSKGCLCSEECKTIRIAKQARARRRRRPSTSDD